MLGMPLHIDESRHQWLSDEFWCEFIVILDDASKETTHSWQRKTRRGQ